MEAVLEGLRAVSTVEVDIFRDSEVECPANAYTLYDTKNETQRKKIYVRLLLSIDRRETTAAAMETVCC